MPYSEGMAPVRLGDLWGYVDRSGAVAIRPQFRNTWRFSGGLAAVRTGTGEVGDQFGYIDHAGRYVWGPGGYSTKSQSQK